MEAGGRVAMVVDSELSTRRSLRQTDGGTLMLYRREWAALLRTWLTGDKDHALVLAGVGCDGVVIVGSAAVGLLRVLRRSIVGGCLMRLACSGSMVHLETNGDLSVWLDPRVACNKGIP